jgi:small GTP-binding protein
MASAAGAPGAEAIKLVLVGNGSSGKSSLVRRFLDEKNNKEENGFRRVYQQTVGVEWFEKSFQLRAKRILLQVWDIGGQSITSAMLSKYLTGLRLVFLVYDITELQSFADLDDWLAKVRSQAPQAHVVLLGNKCDLLAQRQVTPQQHDKFIQQRGLQGGGFCSARSGENVNCLFYKAAARVAGMEMTSYELGFFDSVLVASAPVYSSGNDEGRTAMANEIEAQDLALEAAKSAKRWGRRKHADTRRRQPQTGGGCELM